MSGMTNIPIYRPQSKMENASNFIELIFVIGRKVSVFELLNTLSLSRTQTQISKFGRIAISLATDLTVILIG